MKRSARSLARFAIIANVIFASEPTVNAAIPEIAKVPEAAAGGDPINHLEISHRSYYDKNSFLLLAALTGSATISVKSADELPTGGAARLQVTLPEGITYLDGYAADGSGFSAPQQNGNVISFSSDSPNLTDGFVRIRFAVAERTSPSVKLTASLSVRQADGRLSEIMSTSHDMEVIQFGEAIGEQTVERRFDDYLEAMFAIAMTASEDFSFGLDDNPPPDGGLQLAFTKDLRVRFSPGLWDLPLFHRSSGNPRLKDGSSLEIRPIVEGTARLTCAIMCRAHNETPPIMELKLTDPNGFSTTAWGWLWFDGTPTLLGESRPFKNSAGNEIGRELAVEDWMSNFIIAPYTVTREGIVPSVIFTNAAHPLRGNFNMEFDRPVLFWMAPRRPPVQRIP